MNDAVGSFATRSTRKKSHRIAVRTVIEATPSRQPRQQETNNTVLVLLESLVDRANYKTNSPSGLDCDAYVKLEMVGMNPNVAMR